MRPATEYLNNEPTQTISRVTLGRRGIFNLRATCRPCSFVQTFFFLCLFSLWGSSHLSFNSRKVKDRHGRGRDARQGSKIWEQMAWHLWSALFWLGGSMQVAFSVSKQYYTPLILLHFKGNERIVRCRFSNCIWGLASAHVCFVRTL